MTLLPGFHSCAALRALVPARLLLAPCAVNTATMSVYADDFTIINMYVINSAPRPPPAVVGGQAVAFMSSGNRTLAYNCTFRSFQVRGRRGRGGGGREGRAAAQLRAATENPAGGVISQWGLVFAGHTLRQGGNAVLQEL